MFDNDNLGPEVLSNPSATQYLFIKELETRVGGLYSIASPNNSFCFLGEFGSSLHAQAVRDMSSRFNALYPARAETATDLSAFISDYDIFNMTASPASCQLRMLIPTEWIAQAAVAYNSTYNIIEYPAESVIKYAGKSWSMYYPIQVLYNPTTGNIVAYYNTDNPTDLLTLSSNYLPDTHFEVHNGKKYLSITFPVYQFYRQTAIATAITATTGFNRTYSFSNKFYAVQISTLLNGTWTELSYSLSEQIYDTSTITALLTIDNDNGVLGVRIPQVYFSNGLMGTQVKVVILTTEGKVSFTVTDNDSINIQADFQPSSSTYSKMLTTNQGTIILPGYNQSVISGGADPMSFDTLRSAVIRNALHDGAPISNLQLAVTVAKYGYSLTEYLDNITNRVYYASSPVNDDSSSRVVPVVVSPVVIDPSATIPSTVKVPGDGSLTIMPNTVFSYNSDTANATIVTDDVLASWSKMSNTQLCAALNAGIYTRQPYHVWIDTSTGSPQAKSFDLFNPTLTSLYVVGENDSSPILSSVTAVNISHDDNGTAGFTFTFQMQRITSMTADNLAQTLLLVQFYDRSESLITSVATYTGTDTTSGRDIYQLHLDSTYRLSSDGYIQCSIPLWNGTTKLTDLPLSLDMSFKTLVAAAQIPTVTVDASLNAGVPGDYLPTYVVISTQKAVVTLGTDLSTVVNNNVTTSWGDPVYQTWETDVPYTYSTDLYLRNTDGSLVVDMTSGTPTLVKIASAGENVPAGTDIDLTLTEAAQLGQQTLTLQSVAGLQANMLMRGYNIAPGTSIQYVKGNVITLSQAILGDIPLGSSLQAKNTYIQTTITTAAASGALTLVCDPTNLVTGMQIFCKGVPSGTTITPTSTGVTLSAATTEAISVGAAAAFILPNGPVSYRYRKGDYKRDQYGNLLTSSTSPNIYGVTITQFDERLFRSQNAADITFADSLAAWVYSTATALDPVRADLLEQTKLYYRPYRTMGTATFTGGNDVAYQLALELSFTITYYVSLADKNNTAKQQLIEDSTLSILNTYLQQGMISSTVIANTLKTAFSGMVTDVYVSGIDNGDNKVLAITEAGALPSVANQLTVSEDGTLAYTPALTIIFETAPSAVIQATSATQTSV